MATRANTKSDVKGSRKRSATPKVKSAESSKDNFIIKEGVKLVIGLLSLIVGGIALVSFCSYLFSWSQDMSVSVDNNLFTASQVENSGGNVGLFSANFFISKLFGLGAFILPFLFFGIFLKLVVVSKINVLKLIFLTLFGAVLISLISSYIFSFGVDDWFGYGAGGAYGFYVVAWMKKLVGAIGAGSILALFTIIWLIVISPKFVRIFNSWIDRFVAKLSALFAKREKREEEKTENLIDSNDAEDSVDTLNNEEVAEGVVAEDNIDSEEDDSNAVALDVIDLEDNDTQEPISEDVPLEVVSIPDAPVERESERENVVPELEVVNKGGDNFLGEYSEEELNVMFDPRLDLSSYQSPSLSLLEDYKDKWYTPNKEELERNNRQIVRTLGNYKIGVSRISARIGPTVTLYEIVPAPGVRVSQIKRLEEDIQLSLAAKGVRVVTLVGTNAVGIEVANLKPSTVSMLSALEDKSFKEAGYDLPVALGKTITNEVLHFDLAKMPHLLVAGATGQGKSVGLNAILTSLLYTKHPSEMKLVLVDPKKVELSLYSKLERHFLAMLPDADEPVITDTQKVVYTLKSLCSEMDTRYDLLKLASVRHIKEYNEKFLQRRLNPLKGHKYMPYIVVVIDEFADLLMTAGKEIEEPIARLAQLARAIGIHLVIATQRPTTSVITGNIKANFPARIAFMVRSSIDSRTILDQTGANQLIGRGDMLISTGGDVTRVQCAFIDTKEVERVVDYIGNQRGYTSAFYLPEYTGEDKADDGGGVGEVDLNRRDALFEDAAKLIVMHQQGSTSLIQRKMNLGYNRSGRIIDQLEVAGIVGPFEGSKARQVLISDLSELDAKLSYIKDIYG